MPGFSMISNMAFIDDQSQLPVRKRERISAPKSRGGCVICKRGHIKCDEAKPKCSRCIKSNLNCEYKKPEKKSKGCRLERVSQRIILPKGATEEPSTLIIRPREPNSGFHDDFAVEKDSVWTSRHLESQMRPWERMIPRQASPLTRVLESSDCLAIDMPLKSKELFHYFYVADQQSGVPHKDQRRDCLSFVTNNPHAFRSALIIASLHFVWNKGDLQQFKSTFLVHKVHAIRMVNEWMATKDSSLFTSIVRQVATLCFAELCFADVISAETHLIGIMSLLDHKKQLSRPLTEEDLIEQELADRYFVFTYTCFVGFKSRLIEYLRRVDPTGNVYNITPNEAMALTSSFLQSEAPTGALAIKLAALRLLPSFFNPMPAGVKMADIDGYYTILAMRELTAELDGARIKQRNRINDSTAVFEAIWSNGVASKLLAQYVFSHTRSMSGKLPPSNGRQRFRTTWCGIQAAANMYLHHVVRMTEPGFLEQRAHRYMMYLFRRELSQLSARLEEPDPDINRDFLFWHYFLGAIHMYKNDKESPTAEFFYQGICDWSKASGVTKWADAWAALRGVSWPAEYPDELTGQSVWERARYR
ncbi:hypothetical protein B0J15DRAFT_569038 [Fusarium solani]|uniref:Zn(2)-C6 fungal-type domain-containing protein n=1 Tax=Fusarium solani TaxID=169388 RepID=A0A9P9GJH3_FUSSL|nr:uncharacterized protein B0J15DRAFT_569038 [Fusarium solani]KAH7239690.1 hypothetical protein B0J15DRAFT_569038 [Fusarium solani]